MLISERQQKILSLLRDYPDYTVAQLASALFVSEPTIRRDFTELESKGFITKFYGGARVNHIAPDAEIPFIIRENEKSAAKTEMGRQAAKFVRDGMVIMLDGSTSAFHVVPYLAPFKELIVVTSGAKTAVALAELNIRTYCTGGHMMIHSYSYVGEQAENFVRTINADLLFFSCHSLSKDGKMTEVAIEEANLRRVMMEQSNQKILLCDDSKFGKLSFYNMGNISELDHVISNVPLEFDV